MTKTYFLFIHTVTQTHNPLHMYANKHIQTYGLFENIKRTTVQTGLSGYTCTKI